MTSPGPEPRSARAVSSPRCARCSYRRMVVEPNPYNGVGLAVHEFFYLCPRCGVWPFHARSPQSRRSPRAPRLARDYGWCGCFYDEACREDLVVGPPRHRRSAQPARGLSSWACCAETADTRAVTTREPAEAQSSGTSV